MIIFSLFFVGLYSYTFNHFPFDYSNRYILQNQQNNWKTTNFDYFWSHCFSVLCLQKWRYLQETWKHVTIKPLSISKFVSWNECSSFFVPFLFYFSNSRLWTISYWIQSVKPTDQFNIYKSQYVFVIVWTISRWSQPVKSTGSATTKMFYYFGAYLDRAMSSKTTSYTMNWKNC